MKTVIEMARDAGATVEVGMAPVFYTHNELLKFAEFVRADERAKLAEQPAPAAQEEPIYQCQDSMGKWTDQDKHSYDYNVQHGSATVRVVCTAPQAQENQP